MLAAQVNPPREGDPSHAVYAGERDAILKSLARRADKVHSPLAATNNGIPQIDSHQDLKRKFGGRLSLKRCQSCGLPVFSPVHSFSSGIGFEEELLVVSSMDSKGAKECQSDRSRRALVDSFF